MKLIVSANQIVRNISFFYNACSECTLHQKNTDLFYIFLPLPFQTLNFVFIEIFFSGKFLTNGNQMNDHRMKDVRVTEKLEKH